MYRPSFRTRLVASALAVLSVAVLTASPASANHVPTGVQLLKGGLSSPKGLTFDGNGNPVVSQGAFGAPGPLLRYVLSGPDQGKTQALSAPFGAVAVQFVKSTGAYWILGSDGKLYIKPAGKPIRFVKDIIAFAKAHPDPYNGQDGPADDSNPFGLAVLPNGQALVADAAANSLLRVAPNGNTVIVARFAKEMVATNHIPPAEQPPGGFPAKIPAESVPTSVALGPDGSIYIGELKGFPFRPGSSRIWKLAPGTTGAVCSADPSVPKAKCTQAATGYSSIASLAVTPNNALLVLTYAKGGVGEFEAGCFGPSGCPPAVLLRTRNNITKELGAGKFFEPGTVAVSGEFAYVTDKVLSGGRLQRVAIWY